MSLAHVTIGNGPPVTFLHGFTQTGRTWLPVIEALDNRMTSTLIDAPGHGDSTNGQRTLYETAQDIAGVMSPGALVGYSMGARMALHTALIAPHKVTTLVLISGTAGIDSAEDRQIRRDSDRVLAQHLIEIGVPDFIEEWLALPMFSNLHRGDANIPERLRNTAQGLADSLTYAGTGTQDPLWDRLHTLKMPVLIIAGADDHKFVAHAQRLSGLIGESTLHVVANAGHTVHLEQKKVFCEIFRSFVA